MKTSPYTLEYLKKIAKKSHRSEYEGKEMLGQFPEIGLEELPYWSLDRGIAHLENVLYMVTNQNPKDFRVELVSKQLVEYQLLFIYRYEWEYKNKIPFHLKWIYLKFKELEKDKALLEKQYLTLKYPSEKR